MAKCICVDFRENIEKIEAPFVLQATRGGVGYQGKRFRFCPWCGSELQLEAPDYAQPATGDSK